MRARTIIVMTAIVSMVIGAVVVYLVLTVPNDLQAAATTLAPNGRGGLVAR